LETVSSIKPSRFTLPFKAQLKDEGSYMDSIRTIDFLQPDNQRLHFGGRFGVTRYIAMPTKGEFKVIACPDEEVLYPYYYRLYTVKGNQVVDGLYVEGEWLTEYEEKHSLFSISEDYTITVSTTTPSPDDSVEVKRYRIDEDGYFYDIAKKKYEVNRELASKYLRSERGTFHALKLPFSFQEYCDDSSCGMNTKAIYPDYQPLNILEDYLNKNEYKVQKREYYILPAKVKNLLVLLIHAWSEEPTNTGNYPGYYVIITANDKKITSMYECLTDSIPVLTFTIDNDLVVTRKSEYYETKKKTTERVKILDDGTIKIIQKESEDKNEEE
jgi:hypothetical protein